MGKNSNAFDKDINPLLEIATNEDLEFIVKLLKNTFSNFLERNKIFKEFYPEHQKYADLVADEIREFGGNSFVNLVRRTGPEYKAIVCDVASKLRAPYNNKQDIETIEASILSVILEKALNHMDDEAKRKLLEEMGGKRNYDLTGPALTAAFLGIFSAGGFKSYQIAFQVADAIAVFIFGRGLSLFANTALARWLSILTGPIGWAISGIWTAIDLAGPAYRVTIPAVVYIAMLRMKYNNPVCPGCKKMVNEGMNYCSECGAKVL